jgi:hypothetical protein
MKNDTSKQNEQQSTSIFEDVDKYKINLTEEELKTILHSTNQGEEGKNELEVREFDFQHEDNYIFALPLIKSEENLSITECEHKGKKHYAKVNSN